MKEKELDQLIQQAIEQETELPDGLSQRLEQFVDKLPESSHLYVNVLLCGSGMPVLQLPS